MSLFVAASIPEQSLAVHNTFCVRANDPSQSEAWETQFCPGSIGCGSGNADESCDIAGHTCPSNEPDIREPTAVATDAAEAAPSAAPETNGATSQIMADEDWGEEGVDWWWKVVRFVDEPEDGRDTKPIDAFVSWIIGEG